MSISLKIPLHSGSWPASSYRHNISTHRNTPNSSTWIRLKEKVCVFTNYEFNIWPAVRQQAAVQLRMALDNIQREKHFAADRWCWTATSLTNCFTCWKHVSPPCVHHRVNMQYDGAQCCPLSPSFCWLLITAAFYRSLLCRSSARQSALLQDSST